MLSAVLATSALLHGGEWSLLRAMPGAAAILLYVHVGSFGAATLAGFWSLVNETFDPHTAKREVSRIAMGGTVGGALGGLLAWQLGGATGVPALLVVLALLDVVSVGLVPRLTRKRLATFAADESPSGLVLLGKVPYLRHLALLVGLAALASALLDYVIGAHAVRELASGGDLVAFFALFHAGGGIGAFLVQLLLTRSLLERFGLAAMVAVLPAAILSLGALAVVLPSLWTIVLLRGVEGIVSSSLYRAGYELAYTPLPPAQKRPTKVLIDVGLDRIGTMLGGGLALLVVATVSGDPARLVMLCAMGAAALALVAARNLHSGYVSALARSLESGTVKISEGELVDATTRRTLAETSALDRRALLAEIERRRQRSGELAQVEDPFLTRVADLRSNDPARIRRGLAEPLPPMLAPMAIELLGDDAASHAALMALRSIAPRVIGLCVDVLLDERESAVVRRRIPRVLEASHEPRALSGLVAALARDPAEVRLQAALALSRAKDELGRLSAYEAQILAAARRELELAQGEQDLRRFDRALELSVTLLAILLDKEPLRLAHRALYAADDALRGTALEYLENVLPDELRAIAMPAFSRARRAGATLEPAPPSLRKRPRDELALELMRSREILIDKRALSDPSELG